MIRLKNAMQARMGLCEEIENSREQLISSSDKDEGLYYQDFDKNERMEPFKFSEFSFAISSTTDMLFFRH